MKAVNQPKNHSAAHLKQYAWKKGQSGNLKGRPPGKSLKTFVKEYLEHLADEDKAEFLKYVPPEIAWKMAEGNPTSEVQADVSLIVEVISYEEKK